VTTCLAMTSPLISTSTPTSLLRRGQAQPSVRDDSREREITRESWCCYRGCDTPVSALTREGMGPWPWDAAAGRAAYWRQHAYLPG
jgi:hypothetical protein